MGQVSALESLDQHVDEGQWTQAGIKGKISKTIEEAGKNGQKPEPPSPPPGEKLQGGR